MVFSSSSSSASKTACQRSATMRCAMVFSNHVHERSYNIIGYKWQRSLPFVGAMSFVHGWSVQAIRIHAMRIHSKVVHQQESQTYPTNTYPTNAYPFSTYATSTDPFNAYPFKKFASAGMAMSMSIIACHLIHCYSAGMVMKIKTFCFSFNFFATLLIEYNCIARV